MGKGLVLLLICLLSCSGIYSVPIEKKPPTRNLIKYEQHLVDANTLDTIDRHLKAANPALTAYRTSVLFYLYTKSSVNSPQLLVNNNVTLLRSSKFDSERKTIVVSHGYMDNVNSDITQSIKNALLSLDDVNVIGVDWSYYTKNILYSWVAGETPGVGNYVGRFVNFLIQEGLSADDVHLVGHSLGAHVSGFAGKTLKANGHTAARVTGLDPALPGFSGYDDSSRLSSTDGQFVDCIHTCGGLLGFEVPICQADFYPNGGINVQPGCSWFDFGVCSHGRSYEFFAESINPTHHFNAETCNAIVDGTPYGCSNNGAEMGYFANPQYLGEFYLTTRSSSPFSENITSTD